MLLKKWDDLPENMKNDSVRMYYQYLYKKRFSLLIKRMLDFVTAVLLLVITAPVFAALGILIKIDSKGPVIFKQLRVTQYGRLFYIYKFRTMTHNGKNTGAKVTLKSDPRITRVGKVLRKYRLDELPQLINIIKGDMSFVGTRPEIVDYVRDYTDEMAATLLLPAGVTSYASISFKDEEELLTDCDNVDAIYREKILPMKMRLNLNSLLRFNLLYEAKILADTILIVFGLKAGSRKK
ncbi:MAG: sugar transferase [Clostridiales bacterium]|nr:sugar transferase [Clostridiales bacterium]